MNAWTTALLLVALYYAAWFVALERSYRRVVGGPR